MLCRLIIWRDQNANKLMLWCQYLSLHTYMCVNINIAYDMSHLWWVFLWVFYDFFQNYGQSCCWLAKYSHSFAKKKRKKIVWLKNPHKKAWIWLWLAISLSTQKEIFKISPPYFESNNPKQTMPIATEISIFNFPSPL